MLAGQPLKLLCAQTTLGLVWHEVEAGRSRPDINTGECLRSIISARFAHLSLSGGSPYQGVILPLRRGDMARSRLTFSRQCPA